MVNRTRRNLVIGTVSALFAVLALGAPFTVPATSATPAATTKADLPNIGHVFVIMLENKSYVETFGSQAVPDSYLGKSMPEQGALIRDYYGTSHFSFSNYATLVSGQPPNAYNQSDCAYYREFESTQIDQDGIAHGIGCVYPSPIKSVADQLKGAGKTWKAYAESMDAYQGPGLTKGPGCRHPKLNTYDPTYSDNYDYVTRHVPFLYFHTTIDSPDCRSKVVDYTNFAGDLAKEETTPNFSFIVPNTCSDGHQSTCVDGSPGGLTAINKYLSTAVPMITESPAFKKDGLLLVLFDEAEFDGPDEASSACCDTPLGPNTGSLGGPLPGPGGGRTGAIAISPFIKPGTVVTTPYNHYSTLRTVEDIFGLPYLGYAARNNVSSFGPDVFTNK